MHKMIERLHERKSKRDPARWMQTALVNRYPDFFLNLANDSVVWQFARLQFPANAVQLSHTKAALLFSKKHVRRSSVTNDETQCGMNHATPLSSGSS